MTRQYRPPLEVLDHTDPCWLQWFELVQQYREEEPDVSIATHESGTTGFYHLSLAQKTDLTDAGDSALHFHSSDRARANHTGTQLAATISDFEAAISALMINGEMYNFNTPTTIAIANPNEWTTISSGFTQGDCDGVTFQNNSELKIVTPGKYVVKWAISLDAAAAAVEIEAAIQVNGTINEKTAAHRFYATANDTGGMNGHGLLTLAANDIITLAVNNNTNATDLEMEHANVLITRWLG